MTQTIFTAKEAKNNFGRLLEEVRVGPVEIKKNGRKVAVLLSAEEYNRFESFEDAIWAKRADEAKKGGFIGAKKSMELLKKALNARV